ncbi:hypothetical protein M8C21_006681, partial [Ambrosia artemisiifolia]
MGAGGRMSDPSTEEKDILKRVPVDPPFTLSDLKKAIPAHCFERSVIRSSYYVVHDLIVAYVFYYLANTYIPLLPTPWAYLAWPVYWFCQASILTGLWVIGHECGHHAFSDYQLIDDLLVVTKGAAWVACMYLIPVLGVHMFFVLITYLHHTHLSLPHYDSTEWNWIRGALSTIDRDFGFLNRVFHDVTHTHVLHHLISEAKECIYIEPDEDSEHK